MAVFGARGGQHSAPGGRTLVRGPGGSSLRVLRNHTKRPEPLRCASGPGPDGIGDTPYIIDANSRDDYPLMGIVEIYGLGDKNEPIGIGDKNEPI